MQSAPAARAPFNALPSASCPAQLAKDLVHPSLEDEKRKHKKKRLVQSPNSYFMDVKCPGKDLKCFCLTQEQNLLCVRFSFIKGLIS